MCTSCCRWKSATRWRRFLPGAYRAMTRRYVKAAFKRHAESRVIGVESSAYKYFEDTIDKSMKYRGWCAIFIFIKIWQDDASRWKPCGI